MKELNDVIHFSFSTETPLVLEGKYRKGKNLLLNIIQIKQN